MDTLFALFDQHALAVVFFGVLIEQAGAPLPALPILLLAGAQGVTDGVFAVQALVLATLASLAADGTWFGAGRRWGRTILSLLCRVSISPDSCVRQSEVSFSRRGVATLVIAKFVPGLSTLAPPLAGALGLSWRNFLLFNLAGTALWAGSGLAAGMVFHGQIDALLGLLERLGNVALPALAAVVALYVAARLWRRAWEARAAARLPRMGVGELSQLLEHGQRVLVVDVRPASPQLPLGPRIPGARHVELAVLAQSTHQDWPRDIPIVTYCACPHDASAAKAARLLQQKGITAQVLKGGIDGWSEAGLPLETSSGN